MVARRILADLWQMYDGGAMSDDNITIHPPTVEQAGDPRGKKATWTHAPVDTSDGKCSQCAVKHDPGEPHNQQSLAYQYHFYAEHDRWPTWEDAMAHCSDEIYEITRQVLAEHGVEVKPRA